MPLKRLASAGGSIQSWLRTAWQRRSSCGSAGHQGWRLRARRSAHGQRRNKWCNRRLDGPPFEDHRRVRERSRARQRPPGPGRGDDPTRTTPSIPSATKKLPTKCAGCLAAHSSRNRAQLARTLSRIPNAPGCSAATSALSASVLSARAARRGTASWSAPSSGPGSSVVRASVRVDAPHTGLPKVSPIASSSA